MSDRHPCIQSGKHWKSHNSVSSLRADGGNAGKGHCLSVCLLVGRSAGSALQGALFVAAVHSVTFSRRAGAAAAFALAEQQSRGWQVISVLRPASASKDQQRLGE